MNEAATHRVLIDVGMERNRQNQKWGVQRHGFGDWMAILGEEFGEVSKEAVEYVFGRSESLVNLRNELVQVAAVAVQIIEHIDEEQG